MTDLALAFKDLDENKVSALIDEKISNGVNPVEIIKECNEGMVAIGELFSSGEYFISQLVFSAEIFGSVMQKLEPLMQKGEGTSDSGNVVVIGTVEGDIHDIGKNIVASLLNGSGFQVIDLGVDVPAERFVEKVKETGAKVVGLSALLNFTYPEMKKVVEAFDKAGLREEVKIIIGGAPVDEKVREFTGADYYAEDAIAGVNICKQIYA